MDDSEKRGTVDYFEGIFHEDREAGLMTQQAESGKGVTGLVSVVIITYNQAGFVRETFDSVLSQDYENIEIIIADDGSTDGTVNIINEYAVQYSGKIVSVLNEKNTGIAANFNRGLAKVRGEYIAWLGGDDLMLPGKIRRQVDLLNNRLDAVGCCHDAEVFTSFPDDKILGIFSELYNGTRGFREGGVELWFVSGYFMLPSTVMIRSKAVPAHGFDERLTYLNDWLFDVEVFRQGKCVAINDVLGKYRRHGANVTANKYARNCLAIEESMVALSIVEFKYPELGWLVRKRRSVGFLSAATAAYRLGDSKKYKAYLKIAIRQGAFLKGAILYVALAIFGSYISRQSNLMPYERSPIFVKLSNMIKG